MSKKFFRSPITPGKIPVTLRQLTGAPLTNRGEDSGSLFCKAVYPMFDYDSNGAQKQQVGWSYQCLVKERNNASIFVKVRDMNCVIDQTRLVFGMVELHCNGFRGTWWVDKNGDIQLSCRADSVEVVTPAEVY